MERVRERVLREAGTAVSFQKLLNQTTLLADPSRRDFRRIDVLASGLPFYGGKPLLCDATVRSPLTGRHWRRSGDSSCSPTEWRGVAARRLFCLNVSPCGQLFVIIHKDLDTGVVKHMTVERGTTVFNDRNKTMRLTTVDGKTRTINIDKARRYQDFKRFLC